MLSLLIQGVLSCHSRILIELFELEAEQTVQSTGHVTTESSLGLRQFLHAPRSPTVWNTYHCQCATSAVDCAPGTWHLYIGGRYSDILELVLGHDITFQDAWSGLWDSHSSAALLRSSHQVSCDHWKSIQNHTGAAAQIDLKVQVVSN